jgi:hypothetical protein
MRSWIGPSGATSKLVYAVLLGALTLVAHAEGPSVVPHIPESLVMPDGARIRGFFNKLTQKDGQLTGVGVAAPGVVDGVIVGKGETFLVWIEPSVLTKEAFPRFQDKVNAYAAYALDGRLVKQYPDTVGTKLVIYIVLLSAQPEGRLDNLRSVAPQLKTLGLDLSIREEYK